MDLSQLWGLRRGHPGGLRHCDDDGRSPVGEHCRAAPAANFCGILEDPGKDRRDISSAGEKIFRFFEISICICGKMGYNSEKPYLAAPGPAQRKIP